MDIGVATIISSGIAAITSIFATIFAWRSFKITKQGNEQNLAVNKEITNNVQKAEDKRTEAQIDANITWSACIEWIQNVRRVTAEFITAYYKFIHTEDNDNIEQNKNLELIQEKKALLILYFGPDSNNESNKKAQDICDRTTNNGKNEIIVNLINEICNQLSVYFTNKHEHMKYCDCLNKCYSCENTENEKKYSCEKPPYEGYSINFTEEDCIAFQKDSQEKKEMYLQQMQRLHNNIGLFTEAMRIYLKIEWNHAKKREK